MCALGVYTGNRLENLIDALANLLLEPLSSVMEEEVIVVQSKGMEHWISLELARRHGICANTRFPFPNRFLEDMDRRLTGNPPPSGAFEPDRMRWRILALLQGLIQHPEFEAVRDYLFEDHQGLRRFQLADRLAHLFDQYLVYRPDMILEWESNTKGGWQAKLWRELIHAYPEETHRAARAKNLLRLLESPPSAGTLPERVCVFGISALPRFHMDLLAAVARYTPVNLFLMNPCREYWGDIASDRDISLAAAYAGSGVAESDLHFEQGHSILASTGMMGRDFFDMIHDYAPEEHEYFSDPKDGTLLHAVQSDILKLRQRGRSGIKTQIQRHDDSIRIHACHSPFREVEVLYDSLLERFERDPNLRPADVLVTMPDIETYAPFIQAVFNAPDAGDIQIPYSIADRSVRGKSELISTFLSLLDLGRERFALSRVLSILESPSVLRRFRLSENDLEIVRAWATETGIRWGLDQGNRERLNLPAFHENTWAAGLQRLLLGYAMAGGDEHTFEGLLPFDQLEGGDADVLEKFLEFTSAMFQLLPRLEHPAPPGIWHHTLNRILDCFFEPGEEAQREALALRLAINELQEASETHSNEEPPILHLDVIRCFLGQRFQREGLGFGFMTGGVTFCAMLPMRSIPFRIICCLGLDSDAFPRTHRTPDFDLMARRPRPGDRSRRKDDRYLFLETLLSARDHLHLSYVGQSQKDNAPLPPSVLVSELLDAIERGFETPEIPILEHLVARHPLQAFSPDCFAEDAAPHSYSQENLRSAAALVSGPRTPPPFFSAPLSSPGPEQREVDVEKLIRFFRNPAAFLLRERLGLVIQEAEGPPEDLEPFAIEGLERYQLAERLAAQCVKGEDPWKEFDRARSAGRLPHGPAGRSLFERLTREVRGFVEDTADHVKGELLEPVPVHLEIGDFHLTGSLREVRASGMCHRRFATIKAKDRLKGWIGHLVLNVLEVVPEHARQTSVIGLSGGRGPRSQWTVVHFPSVDAAEELLLNLLGFYWKGLCAPLPFFPDTSWAYAHALQAGDTSGQKALTAARRKWEGNEHTRGDREDPYVQLCFGNQDPLETEWFQECASVILHPMMDAESSSS